MNTFISDYVVTLILANVFFPGHASINNYYEHKSCVIDGFYYRHTKIEYTTLDILGF